MDAEAQPLRTIGLFAELPDKVLQQVARAAVRRTYDPGVTIIVEGEPCRVAYFVAEGQVRAYRTSPGGREQVLAQLGPGQAFNTVPLFRSQAVNHATAQALTPVVVYAIGADDLRRLVAEHPPLALVMLGDFAARLDHLTDLVEDLSLRTVRGRLARFLLESADAGTVARRWTQEEIAARLGTVRDVVGRTLRAFADDGLVRVERHRIELVDREGLEAEAES
jgi:CRP-like cAMP-binding protein